VYTIGFPVGLWVFLHRNQTLIKDHYRDLVHPFYKELGFIWNDYRQVRSLPSTVSQFVA
jgi:hypothetical protein